MKTNKYLAVSLLAALALSSCSNNEEEVIEPAATNMELSAGIGQSTRAVIDANYGNDLEVAFVRMNNPASNTTWITPAIDATRAGGSGNTAITFATAQTYSSDNGISALIGYYPRKTLENGTSNPISVKYEITGDEDIMATELQTGAANNQFAPFTFQHLLTQLQFKCAGSAEAANKWTAISSIKIKNVATGLTLSLDKTDGATLAATGTANQELSVVNCPATVSAPSADAEPQIGYLMLYPATDMGTETSAISLEVVATYNGVEKTLNVPINNISGGVQAGQSHLITLNFTIDGEITVEAGIAEWQPGNGGSSIITPKN